MIFIKGINYLNQTDLFRCGPIAIINVLKFCGFSISKEALVWLDALTNCNTSFHKRGTYPNDLFKALKGFEILTGKFTIRRVKYDYKRFNKKDRCHIINHFTRFDEDGRLNSHYILVLPNEGGKPIVINPAGFSFTAIHLTKFYRNKYLNMKFKRGEHGLKHSLPMMWEIRRK